MIQKLTRFQPDLEKFADEASGLRTKADEKEEALSALRNIIFAAEVAIQEIERADQ